MAIIIDIPDKGWSSKIVTINKNSYELEVSYNSRFGFWVIGLKDINGNVLFSGQKVVPVKEFLRKHNAHLTLNGLLFVDSYLDAPVGRNTFGNNKEHQLMFMTAEEFNELQVQT